MNLTTKKHWLALSLLGLVSLVMNTTQAAIVGNVDGSITSGEYQLNTAAPSNPMWNIDGASNDEAIVNAQVSAVPVPAAFWLFGTALLGFIGMSRRTQV